MTHCVDSKQSLIDRWSLKVRYLQFLLEEFDALFIELIRRSESALTGKGGEEIMTKKVISDA